MVDNQALWRFFERELFALTLGATAQRSDLYASDLGEAARRPFQNSLRQSLETLAESYRKSVAESLHIANIQRLGDELSGKHSELLVSGRMRFGHAQKALNLYLKYLWCLQKVEEPPHFPVDSIILKKIPKFTTFRWTRMESSEQYVKIIEAAREQARRQNLSLACWELREYKRRDA